MNVEEGLANFRSCRARSRQRYCRHSSLLQAYTSEATSIIKPRGDFQCRASRWKRLEWQVDYGQCGEIRSLTGLRKTLLKSSTRQLDVSGAIAQLGERIVRNDEVVGSIPTSSTKFSTT